MQIFLEAPVTLSDRQRLHLADRAADTLARIAVALSHVDAGLMFGDRLRQAQAGPPAASWDRTNAGRRLDTADPYGPPATSDPTGESAVNAVVNDRAGDRATAIERELDRTLRRVAGDVERIADIVAAYGPARPAGAADRLALARQNTPTPPGCASCARCEAARGVSRWEPIDSRLRGPTTAGGRIPAPMHLCVFCHDKLRLWDRLPTVAELTAHHEGRRVRWPTDVPRPA